MVLVAGNSVITSSRDKAPPSQCLSLILQWGEGPPQAVQELGGGSYLLAEEAAKAGGASCAPRGQGEEGAVAPGRGGRSWQGLEGRAGLHRWHVLHGGQAWGRRVSKAGSCHQP